MRLGIIGGTGLTHLVGEPVVVETPYAPVEVTVAREGELTTFFVPRHAAGHAVPAHRIDHRANVAALAACRVDRVVSVNAVGALRDDVAVPGFLVPDDALDLSNRPATFYDDVAVHVDMSTPYCSATRRALVEASTAGDVPVHDGGVYVTVPGPRLETPAEVRRLAERAHVVGMTGMPETSLAREAGLCYASLSVATNRAAAAGEPVAATAIREAFEALRPAVEAVLADAADRLPEAHGCACRQGLEDAFLSQKELTGVRPTRTGAPAEGYMNPSS